LRDQAAQQPSGAGIQIVAVGTGHALLQWMRQ
jgi:hypothetical protein